MNPRETQEVLEEEEVPTRSPQEEAESLLMVMPDNIRGWLLGETQEEPPELSAAMDQVAERINMATAYIVVQRLAQMSRTLHFLQEIEEGLFDPSRIKNMDASERMKNYKTITKETSEFLEFTRKFTLQNKEMFSRKSQADELANILRELDPSVVQELLRTLSKKGAGTTVNDLIRTPGAPPSPPRTEKAKKSEILAELLDED